MGERKISKIIYLIVAIFFAFVMVKALYQSSNISLKNITQELIECQGGELLSENEGKLVLVTGIPTYDESDILKDEEYNVEVNDAVLLNRNSYQYRYYKEKDSDEAFKNSSIDEKYYVTKGWVESTSKKSENLYEANDQYSNPESKLSSAKYFGSFNVGEFKINSDIVRNKTLFVENNYYGLKDGENDILGTYHVIKENGIEYLSNVEDNTIKIGNYRINFTYYNFKYNQEYSFVGKQVGNTIERYETKEVNLYDTYEGNYSKEELLEKLKSDYNDAKFGVVFVFIIILLIGLYIFRDNIENIIDKIKNKK